MGGSGQQSHTQSQPQPPPSAEEEALKRNTDCVYFLASPLTCKKGNDCEYRHSDVARLNPRDCYFWLHGNCLNPKCGFRHPPLDGLLGMQNPTSTGPSAPLPQVAAAPSRDAASNIHKEGQACIFFQKGYCMKGDWCPFVHLPSTSSNKTSLALGTGSVAEPTTNRKPSTVLSKPVQEKTALLMKEAKYVKDFPQVKQTSEVKPTPALPRNDLVINRRIPQASGTREFPGYNRPLHASNGIHEHWSGHVQQPHPFHEPESNIKDAEELSREPSPGFDVLVDDENNESDYYPGDDRYGMSMENEAGNESDINRNTDYNMIAAVEDERYHSSLSYDSLERRKDQHRSLSERMSGGSHSERTDTLGHVDLRHRLSKHNRSNGLRSATNHEHTHDQYVGDRNYQAAHRDERRIPLNQNTRSSRLQGRISFPRSDRTSISSRLAPARTNMSSTHGRIQDRIKGRLDGNNGGKNHQDLHTRKDTAGDNSANFAGPKSLAELKNKKNGEPVRLHTTDQQSLGKRKQSTLDDRLQNGNDLSFKGPKPLEEILKRKRGETTGPINGGNSSNNQRNIVAESQDTPSLQKTDAGESGSALNPIPQSVEGKMEAEENLHPEAEEGQESEAYDERINELEYEQVHGEDLYTYDGDNGDAEDEYIDEEEDEDDDFAKKMGVMYS
ncbi:zinc finger CCCH domain-containing protein 17-like [Andrographis paniculata]|uniref:zinc finger CCCH domain-containing protein 17-like n=1 Tax=Andrographis paniculata TaxID=175694 RepID=UPI0021E8B862|nr:zinc finger CCCH domain-containing protein 17-like [Andrographis paniculata]